APGVDNRGSNVINQLLLDQLLAIVNGIEHLADGQRSCRMLANQPETLLQFCGRRIFQPEQMIAFKLLSCPRRFDARHVTSALLARTPCAAAKTTVAQNPDISLKTRHFPEAHLSPLVRNASARVRRHRCYRVLEFPIAPVSPCIQVSDSPPRPRRYPLCSTRWHDHRPAPRLAMPRQSVD